MSSIELEKVAEQLVDTTGLGKTVNHCQRLVAAAGYGKLSVVEDILEDHPRKVPK